MLLFVWLFKKQIVMPNLLDTLNLIAQNGPTRVVINSDGEALPPGRAKREQGIEPDMIFVRYDGWSLGAPMSLRHVAESKWVYVCVLHKPFPRTDKQERLVLGGLEEEETIKLILVERRFSVIDTSTEKFPNVTLAPGVYELEQIKNPRYAESENWLVIKGTKVGAAMTYWKSHCEPKALRENRMVIE